MPGHPPTPPLNGASHPRSQPHHQAISHPACGCENAGVGICVSPFFFLLKIFPLQMWLFKLPLCISQSVLGYNAVKNNSQILLTTKIYFLLMLQVSQELSQHLLQMPSLFRYPGSKEQHFFGTGHSRYRGTIRLLRLWHHRHPVCFFHPYPTDSSSHIPLTQTSHLLMPDRNAIGRYTLPIKNTCFKFHGNAQDYNLLTGRTEKNGNTIYDIFFMCLKVECLSGFLSYHLLRTRNLIWALTPLNA